MSDIWTLIDPRPCQWRGCGRPLHSVGSHDSKPHWHSDDAHPATDDCHAYIPPKEEPMPKPVTVHTGRIVSILAEVDPSDGSGTTEVTIRLDGRPDSLELGGPAVFAESIPDLMLDLSRAEQRVIDAAIRLVDSIRDPFPVTGAISAMEQVRLAVEALRETAKKGGR